MPLMGLLDNDPPPGGYLFGNAQQGLLSDAQKNALLAVLDAPMQAPGMVRNALIDALTNAPRWLGFAPPARSVAEGFQQAPQNALAALGLLPMAGPNRMPPAAAPQAVAPDALALARQLAVTPPAPLPGYFAQRGDDSADSGGYNAGVNVKQKHIGTADWLSPSDLRQIGEKAPPDFLNRPFAERRALASQILGRELREPIQRAPQPDNRFAVSEAARRAAEAQQQQIAAGRAAIGDAESAMVRAYNDRVAADVRAAGARGAEGIAENPLFQPAASADDIAAAANPSAQGKAFEAWLEARGIPARRIAASDLSDYYEVRVPGRDDPLKVRFSDHANTSRLHRAPDINVAPGGDHTFYDAILAILGR